MTPLADKALILFQGDSITDAGRNRNDSGDLGRGYALMAAARMQAAHPAKGLRCLNRGISGNRVTNLAERWSRDCLDLKPDLVSILIGINDVWRRYDSDDPTDLAAFVEGYRDILVQTASIGAAIVLCEPFLLPVNDERKTWREDLDPKIQAVRDLAREFAVALVPYDGLFAAAAVTAEPASWAGDGVHPSPAGHALMAQAWIEAVTPFLG